MTRHDEPNEYGFAGDPTLPEPARPHGRDKAEEEAAEDVAVPGSDVATEITEALEETEGKRGERPGTRHD
ncbi:hypothetical protein AB0J86_12855 [Micromonospora sp. NPDC049559]|uniref:hypothetical protein n=1 Tax=Micromonospora sp. NPDC049559 TaxID=3155923 RepID=UPI003447EA45